MSKSLKGGKFERELCCRLGLWWTQDWQQPRSDVFWRTAGSGARATVRAKKGLETVNSHGDIAAIDHVGAPFLKLFACEVKRGYSKFTIADVLDQPLAKKNAKGEVVPCYEDWFRECERKRKESGARWWLLIAKRDKRRPLVFTEEGAFLELGLDTVPNIVLSHCYRIVIGARLDDFLQQLKPERCRTVLQSSEKGPQEGEG